ncbi:hypothetical protein BJ508DRAFT_414914 [Ascobolus immersus RN42]|uniref:F-box domain-containing protein n=1 Tax=Ascobolus immersus RN42 TaxID=1160509 RepID=A0A3N4IAV3_ASCIM|nr:hypothetical protein BJ508DRAFT_414914 [Ascobolus immersus RN42]
MEDTEELSRFRQQWQEEVQRRRGVSSTDDSTSVAKGKGKTVRRPSNAPRPHGPITATTVPVPGPSSSSSHVAPTSPKPVPAMPATVAAPTSPKPVAVKPIVPEEQHQEHVHDPHVRLAPHITRAAPTTALQHFEQAVEKEGQGDLGESLKLYRKAFRMDDAVDKAYREKYFGKSWKAGAAPVMKPTEKGKKKGKKGEDSLGELVKGFAGLKIQASGVLPAETETEEEVLPAVKPSPFSTLPQEILLEILRHVARLDLTTFVRLSLVCKPLAYLVHTEDRIWRSLCKKRWYFGGMQYGTYGCDVLGGRYVSEDGLEEVFGEGRVWEGEFGDSEMALDEVEEVEEGQVLLQDEKAIEELVPKVNPRLVPVLDEEEMLKYGSWRRMFMERPRIRFNGIYISTVNYTRQGIAAGSFSTAVHIVTYYRYIRFLPSGQVLSLLTTHHPTEIVPHFSLIQPTLPADVSKTKIDPAALPSHQAEWRSRLMTGHWFLYPPSHPLFPNQLKLELCYLDPRRRRYMYRMRMRVGNVEGRKSAKLGWMRYWSVGAGEGAEEVEFGGLRIEGDKGGYAGGGYGTVGAREGREKPFFFSRVGGVEREIGIV